MNASLNYSPSDERQGNGMRDVDEAEPQIKTTEASLIIITYLSCARIRTLYSLHPLGEYATHVKKDRHIHIFFHLPTFTLPPSGFLTSPTLCLHLFHLSQIPTLPISALPSPDSVPHIPTLPN